MRNPQRKVTLCLTCLAVCFAVTAGAQLPTSEAGEFLGEWTLGLEMQGTAVEMTLDITDLGGVIAASLSSSRDPETSSITSISRDQDTLELQWERDYGGQTITLVPTAIDPCPYLSP